MKKYLNYVAAALMAVALTGCGSSTTGQGENAGTEAEAEQNDENTLRLKVEESQAYGETGKYLSVVPGTYALSYKSGNLRVKLRLKLEQPLAEALQVSIYPSVMLGDADEAEVVEYRSSLSIDNKEKFDSFIRSEAGCEADFLFEKVMVKEKDAATALKNTKHFLLQDLTVKTQSEIDEAAKESKEAFEQMDKMVDNCKDMIEVGKTAVDMLDDLQ